MPNNLASRQKSEKKAEKDPKESGLLIVKTKQTKEQSAIKNVKITNILALTLVASIALLVIVSGVNPALANNTIFAASNSLVVAGLFATIAYRKDSSDYRESEARAHDLDLVHNFLLGKQPNLEATVDDLLSKFKKKALTAGNLLDVVNHIVSGNQDSLANKKYFIQDNEGFEGGCQNIYQFLNSKEYSYQNDNFESFAGKAVQKFILMKALLTGLVKQKQNFEEVTIDDLVEEYRKCGEGLLETIKAQYPKDGNKDKIEQIGDFMQTNHFLNRKETDLEVSVREFQPLQEEGERHVALNNGRK